MSPTPKSRNHARGFTLLAALAVVSISAVAVPSQAAVVVVANPTFAANTYGWTPTSSATLKRVVFENGTTAGHVVPKSSAGAKTIGIVSKPSGPIPLAGTLVRVGGLVRSSQAQRTIRFQLRELSATGSVINRSESRVVTSTTGWYRTGTSITTSRANSRVSLYVHEAVTHRRYLQVRAIRADLTAPRTPAPEPSPSPPPEALITPTPSASATPEPSPSPTATSTPEPDPTPTPTPTPTPASDPSPAPTATPTPEPSPTPNPTPAPEPSPSPSPSPTPASTPDCGAEVLKASGEAWQCTFADDFSGTTLDNQKWETLTTAASNLRGTGDCWVGNPDTLIVSDGVLRLTSRRMDNPFTCTMANGTTYETQVASGSVTTYGKFAQTYGRFDIRARFPDVTRPGSHGALWMTPQTNTYGLWPASGEIDIAEFYSQYPDRLVPFVHYYLSSTDGTETNTTCMVADPWNFHTYSLVWIPGRIVITIDGAPCVDHQVQAASPLTGSQPFDQPFVVNLTQTLGIGTNAPVEDLPLPLTTEVDFVRVWS